MVYKRKYDDEHPMQQFIYESEPRAIRSTESIIATKAKTSFRPCRILLSSTAGAASSRAFHDARAGSVCLSEYTESRFLMEDSSIEDGLII